MQILSINDWNREQEKCIPLRFRCDGRSYPDDGAEDEDDGGEDDYDEYDDIYIMVKCLSVTFLLISFSPISGHFWV